jgi:hypothetical protein
LQANAKDALAHSDHGGNGAAVTREDPPVIQHVRRRRRLAYVTLLGMATSLAGTVLASGAPATAADPQPWGVSYDLNKNNDIEELSRRYDLDEDGRLDPGAAAELPAILNAQDFSIHVKACGAPKGFVSIDWQLSRLDGGDPLPVYTSTECETDIPLPDKPYPEARWYDLRAVVHYPATPDQVVTTRVHVQDVFMVGLGDSYGSGEGNPITVDSWFGGDATWDNTRCHRSRLSGQEQGAHMLDQIPGINVTFLHLACSGALVSEGILTPYAGLIPRDPPLPTQIDQAVEYVNASAGADGVKRSPDIVVASIGGNDAGFATVVKACLLPPWVPVPIPIFPYVVPVDVDECYEPQTDARQAFDDGLAALPGLYADMDAALEANLCGAANGCDFMISEYPDGATDENGDTCEHAGFTEDEFQWVRDEMVPSLNETIRTRAHDLGWVYVNDIQSGFDRHGICAEDDYFRDIFESLELQSDINGAFHPNADGHLFGYAPAIAESARYALGFPYSWDTLPRPMYAGNGSPATCDTTRGDGNRERYVPAPPTDVAALNLPSTIAQQYARGGLPNGMAGSNTCAASTSVVVPPGTAIREMRTGAPGCPDDPRPCADSSAGSTLLRFPVWTDEAPAIDVRADSDVARSAGQENTDAHRHGTANAQGTTAFYAAPFNGSSTVTGEILVDLSTITQAAGANAYSLSDFTMEVDSVTADPDCDENGEYCSPNTVREIADVHVSIQRGTCEEDAEYLHDCQTWFGYPRAYTDSVDVSATAGDQTILDVNDSTSGPQTHVIGSVVPVSGGLRTPARLVRLPYSVPAGSVVTIQVSAGAYTTAAEGCVLDWNNMPCTAQARSAARITFDADLATGALMPISGFVPGADTTAPTATATTTGPAGTNGWYTGPASVAIQASDDRAVESISYAVDGGTPVVVGGATADVAVTSNGTHQVVFTAKDSAGNASAPQTVIVKVDAAAPTIALTATDGAEFERGAAAPSGVQCTDLLSGIAACTGPAQLDTSATGTFTATFTATDLAGNGATTTLQYTVVDPPPPPAPTADAIALTIPELGFAVNGTVTSGGFTITRSASGQPIAVSGTAQIAGTDGSVTTVTVLAVRVLGVWTGATQVTNPAKRVNVLGTMLSRNGISAAGPNAVTGTFTTGRPVRTITWTITDIV